MQTHKFESIAPGPSRILEVEESVIAGAAFIAVEVDGIRQIGVHLDGPKVRSLIAALKEYAEGDLAHVFDLDGDLWHEEADGLFRLDGTQRTAPLDEVEETYGIDGRKVPGVEDAPAFVEGVKARVVANTSPVHYLPTGSIVTVKSASVSGETVTVEGHATMTDKGDGFGTSGEPRTQWVSADDLEVLEGPAFEVGSTVRLAGPHYIADGMTEVTYSEAPSGEGSLATVTAQNSTWGEGRAVHVRWHGDGKTSVVAVGSLVPVVAEDAGDTTGAQVFVTGDSEGWGHSFERGDLVEVIPNGDDSLLDGSYEVQPVGGDRSESEFVGASDLDVEDPLTPLERLATMPQRFVTGVDPSVRDWSDLLPEARPLWTLPEPAPVRPRNYCSICRTAPCSLGLR